jgi:catechol 2,3-dioxygenase-like lactoylglutathione lyase family enzyme
MLTAVALYRLRQSASLYLGAIEDDVVRIAKVSTTGIHQSITFLFTQDLEAGERFYGQSLGLPLVYSRERVRIFGASNHCFIGLTALPGRVSQPDGMTLALVVDDVRAWYDKLTRAGIAADHPPQYNETFAIEVFSIRDPFGYKIEILSMRDKAWPAP